MRIGEQIDLRQRRLAVRAVGRAAARGAEFPSRLAVKRLGDGNRNNAVELLCGRSKCDAPWGRPAKRSSTIAWLLSIAGISPYRPNGEFARKSASRCRVCALDRRLFKPSI